MQGSLTLNKFYQFSMGNTGIFPKLFAIEESELLEDEPKKIEVGKEIVSKKGPELHIKFESKYDVGCRQQKVIFVLVLLKKDAPSTLFCDSRRWFVSISAHPKLVSDIGDEIKLQVSYRQLEAI